MMGKAKLTEKVQIIPPIIRKTRTEMRESRKHHARKPGTAWKWIKLIIK
jgi:hypothetical protein